MAIRDRLIEILFSLKDQFSKPAATVKGAYKEIGDSADRAESRVSRASRGIVSAFKRIGAALAGVFSVKLAADAINEFAGKLDDLAKKARRLDTSVEELSKLAFAAEQTGTNLETVIKGLERSNRVVSEAAAGYGTARDAIKELGLSAVELEKLTADERLKTIADALDSVTGQTDKARIAYQLFGRAGNELILITEGGRAGLEKYGDELERIGGVMTTEAATAAEQYNDSLNRLQKNFDAIANKAGPPVLDFFNKLFQIAGLGSRDLNEVTAEILKLEKLIQGADAGNLGDMFRVEFATDDLRARLEELKAEQQRLIDDAVAAKADGEKREKQQADRARAAELAATQKHVNAIKAEFDKLVERPKKEKPAAELDLIDISAEIAKSMSSLAQGDFDKAVDDARAAGDMLNRMREEGKYADIVLDGMAQKIRDIAVESAKEKTGTQIKVSVDTVTLADVQRTLDSLTEPRVIPIRLEQDGGTAALEWEAAKRGAKL